MSKVSNELGSSMAAIAGQLLESLGPAERDIAIWPAPGADERTEQERRRWYYTPTDHGGVPIGSLAPPQQQLVHRLLAVGLSEVGYNTVSTVIGLENVLDRLEGFETGWGHGRGRDPGRYYLRIFGRPSDQGCWAWRFGGHHISINCLIVDGQPQAFTPFFLGADPAESPLIGGDFLRPLGSLEDAGRALMLSLTPSQQAEACIHPVAPVDLVGANRSEISVGDSVLPLNQVWRDVFSDPDLVRKLNEASEALWKVSDYDVEDLERVGFGSAPSGLSCTSMSVDQLDLLARVVAGFRGRVESSLLRPIDLAQCHFAWAGSLVAGVPSYYRVEGPDILAEWVNSARGANHAHSVWRDPHGDFGSAILGKTAH